MLQASDYTVLAVVNGSTTSFAIPSDQVPTLDLRVRAFTAAGASELSERAVDLTDKQAQSATVSSADQSLSPALVVVVVAVALLLLLGIGYASFVLRSATSKICVPVDPAWETPREIVDIGQEIGRGAHGTVSRGVLLQAIRSVPAGTVVAVKSILDDTSPTDVQDLVKECQIMMEHSKPGHRYILKLVGLTMQAPPYLLLTEFCERGDLHRLLVTYNTSIPLPFRVRIICQMAEGMDYLAGHNVVHRDLAARNILVCQDWSIRIADYGLSRNLKYRDYYRSEGTGGLPVRWTAPEALFTGICTIEVC